MHHAVIMAGGSGTRMWPLSRKSHPKQLLRIFDGQSLLRRSYERLAALLPPQQIYVITGRDYLPAIGEELPELPRENLFGEQPVRFTEQMAWRCIVPIESVPTEVGIGRDEYVGWIGPTGHVICYPIRGGSLYNIFAGHVTDEWVDESWAVPSSIDELLAGYRGWHPALLEMLGQVSDCYKWGIRDRDPLPRWTAGVVTLLGDAAHPMMPTLAQGAAISLEDGFVLARHLAQHRDDPASGLVGYEAERRPRASRVVLQAREQFQNNRKNPAPAPLSRDWIFAHDATVDTVPAG